MRDWLPHVTVATVVERQGQYLLVEERDKMTGAMVLNQPAGHLEQGETLAQAALRETLEETAWEVELTGVLGVALYTAASNNITYNRICFVAKAIRHLEKRPLDPDISTIHWLDYEAILRDSARMRSPLVIASIEQYRKGHSYPLDLIYSE